MDEALAYRHTLKREFWERAFLVALDGRATEATEGDEQHHASVCAAYADAALVDWIARWGE